MENKKSGHDEKMLKKVHRIYDESCTEKDKCKDIMSECLAMSFPSNPRLNDTNLSKSDSLQNKTRWQYDDTLKIASSRMVNYISDTLTPAGHTWANFKIDVKTGDDDVDETGNKLIRTVGDVVTETVFKALNDCNATNPLTQAYENLVGGGTGAVKVIEMPPFSKKPIQIKNLPLDKLFFNEDTYEYPEFCFFKHVEVGIDYLEDLFGKDKVCKSDDMLNLMGEDLDAKKYTFIEGVILLEHKRHKNKYLHFVCDEAFQHFYYKDEKNYNPIVVFRWSKSNDNFVWGMPIATKTLSNIRTLNENVRIEMEKARLNLRPPMVAFLDSGSLPYIDLETFYKQVTYEEGKVTILKGLSGLQPVITNHDMQWSAVNSDQIRQTVYSLFNVNPLGDVQSTRYRTAEEMALRHQEFNRQFAPTYGRLMNELLRPLLLTVVTILKKKGFFKLSKEQQELIDGADIEYVNPLTKLAAQEKIQNAINFKMMMSRVVDPTVFKYLFDDVEFAYTASEELNIPAKVLNDKVDVYRGLEEEQNLQRQLLQQQAMMPQEG